MCYTGISKKQRYCLCVIIQSPQQNKQHTPDKIKLISNIRRRNLHADLVVFWVKLIQHGIQHKPCCFVCSLKTLQKMMYWLMMSSVSLSQITLALTSISLSAPLKNSSVNKTNVTILSHNIRIKNRNNRSCTNASGICQLPPTLRNKILYIFLEFILT